MAKQAKFLGPGKRKPRIGIYLSCNKDAQEDYQRSLQIVQALQLQTDNYDLYLYSPHKVWQQYCRQSPLHYRPFPTSGASNIIGRRIYGKDLANPPEWMGQMLSRKAQDENLIVLLFPAASSMTDHITVPTIGEKQLLDILPAGEKPGSAALSKQLMTAIKSAIAQQSDSPQQSDGD
ncbi:MAG: hypothetical protein FWF11_01170 [Coriobacteriia bacterium]|nr:hypothetical protein [Coriobacteriia bacterium]